LLGACKQYRGSKTCTFPHGLSQPLATTGFGLEANHAGSDCICLHTAGTDPTYALFNPPCHSALLPAISRLQDVAPASSFCGKISTATHPHALTCTGTISARLYAYDGCAGSTHGTAPTIHYMQQRLPQLVLNAILNAASGMPLPWLPAITRCPSLPVLPTLCRTLKVATLNDDSRSDAPPATLRYPS
jgi:hypothetical protein